LAAITAFFDALTFFSAVTAAFWALVAAAAAEAAARLASLATLAAACPRGDAWNALMAAARALAAVKPKTQTAIAGLGDKITF
jgi:hypothetical protein